MMPDYSNIYFPPPPGAASTLDSAQNVLSNAVHYPRPSSPRLSQPVSTTTSQSHMSSLPLQSSSSSSWDYHSRAHAFQSPTHLAPSQTRSNPSPQTQSTISQNAFSNSLASSQSEVPAYPPPPYQTAPTTAASMLPSSSTSSTQWVHTVKDTSSHPRGHLACMALQGSDRLSFLRFPADLIPLIRATILSAWPRGIQGEMTIGQGARQFKLKGCPWSLTSGEAKLIRAAFGDNITEQAIHARRLMCSILAALHGEGWMLLMSSSTEKVQSGTDSLLFRYRSPAPQRCEWFSMDFTSVNKLQFVDAPKDICMKVVEYLSANKTEVRCKEHKVAGCFEIKICNLGLQGRLAIQDPETMKVEALLLNILEVFEENGWRLYASVGQSIARDFEGQTDIWYLCRPVGQTSSA